MQVIKRDGQVADFCQIKSIKPFSKLLKRFMF